MPSVGSRFRIRRRRSPFAAVLPAARSFLTFGLVMAMLVSIYQHFTSPWEVGALEFTPHVVGSEGEASGILGIDSADMDGDGDIDIVTAGNDGIKVYEQDGKGRETYTSKIIDDQDGIHIQIIDFNDDDNPDILVTLAGSSSVKWYKNEGGLEFSGAFIGTGSNGQAFGIDLDSDGDNDIVVAASESETYVMRAWFNDGTGSFASTTITSSGDPTVTAIGAGDFDGEGYPDIAVSGSGGIKVFDTADGSTWTRYDVDTDNTDHTYLVVADVNSDEKPDITLTRQNGDAIEYYRYSGVNEFEKNTVDTDIDATIVRVSDLDEDGDEDLIVTAQDDNTIFWYENNGEEEFTQRTLASDVTTVFGVTTDDFDGDGDLDFAAGNHAEGTILWYEQTLSKPVATVPSNIRQTTDGAGRVTFDTIVSDDDFEQTRLRIQYSTDGTTWHKPWLLRVTPAKGSVDLKNSNGYQVGTSNGIDTDDNASVKLTLLWDTKSSENTGGPIKGDVNTVQLRIIPNDGNGNGDTVVSSKFRVDNSGPSGLSGLTVTGTSETSVALSWNKPTDSSTYVYQIFYGTDHAAVLEQRATAWDEDDDADMNDIEATSTTITGLTQNTTYTFKIFATDAFGNIAAAPSVRGTAHSTIPTPTPTAATITPTPTLAPGATPPPATPTPTPTPISSEPLFGTPTPTPTATPGVEISSTPTPTATPPSTTFENEPPIADAGLNQAVNPSALVILDGSASTDLDNEPLSFVWRQLSGPAVELVSERTATPSFSAGEENETYIFALTVRDRSGASAGDTVTVAVRPLPPVAGVPVETGEEPGVVTPTESTSPFIQRILSPLDIGLLLLALLLTAVSLLERVFRSVTGRTLGEESTQVESSKGKVVHFRTGEAISGALVLVYSEDGKLRSRERTNAKGEFATLFPPGQYTIGVQSENFTFSPAASPTIKPESGILYSGGKITVPTAGKPLSIVIPMKPTGREITALRTRFLHIWQGTQQWSRLASWPVFIFGSLLNTVLIFLSPSPLYLGIEVAYVILIIIKVALEVRMRPAYGLVRDAITHVPADLSVVRLFEQGTNRLVMTRVTDSQGKFFALPPTGTYTVTVTKSGYAIFSKENVKITSEHDSVLQMTADLMPVAPQSALAQARTAIL
ncbi:MAG: VCBS repeat-containing protein [Candidatus Andersenbacteria bacterium]|nr:VCBS repeat-containing protein [Candidatus Andersenbacteria bacterium]MBI3251003.1 VCBS repeat-containing protein [Candidatus Andersenbacteria bacterium]